MQTLQIITRRQNLDITLPATPPLDQLPEASSVELHPRSPRLSQPSMLLPNASSFIPRSLKFSAAVNPSIGANPDPSLPHLVPRQPAYCYDLLLDLSHECYNYWKNLSRLPTTPITGRESVRELGLGLARYLGSRTTESKLL